MNEELLKEYMNLCPRNLYLLVEDLYKIANICESFRDGIWDLQENRKALFSSYTRRIVDSCFNMSFGQLFGDVVCPRYFFDGIIIDDFYEDDFDELTNELTLGWYDCGRSMVEDLEMRTITLKIHNSYDIEDIEDVVLKDIKEKLTKVISYIDFEIFGGKVNYIHQGESHNNFIKKKK